MERSPNPPCCDGGPGVFPSLTGVCGETVSEGAYQLHTVGGWCSPGIHCGTFQDIIPQGDCKLARSGQLDLVGGWGYPCVHSGIHHDIIPQADCKLARSSQLELVVVGTILVFMVVFITISFLKGGYANSTLLQAVMRRNWMTYIAIMK